MYNGSVIVKVPKIHYVFRRSVNKEISLAQKGLLPKDYFYYLHYIKTQAQVSFSDNYFNQPLLRAVQLIANQLSYPFFGTDIPLFIALSQLAKCNESDLVIATTPKIGLALSVLKKYGLLCVPLAMSTCGLYDLVTSIKLSPAQNRIGQILKSADAFLFGSSEQENKLTSHYFHLPEKKFYFGGYGVDTNYFYPVLEKETDIVLGIGIDASRDWQQYKEVAEALPHLKFLLATDPRLIKIPMPENVRINYFSTPELLINIQRAGCVIILSQPNHHLGGLMTILRCMSCAKATIITRSFGSNEYGFENNANCLYVEPGNTKQIVMNLRQLITDPHRSVSIGKAARGLILKKYDEKKIAAKHYRLFRKIISSS